MMTIRPVFSSKAVGPRKDGVPRYSFNVIALFQSTFNFASPSWPAGCLDGGSKAVFTSTAGAEVVGGVGVADGLIAGDFVAAEASSART